MISVRFFKILSGNKSCDPRIHVFCWKNSGQSIQTLQQAVFGPTLTSSPNESSGLGPAFKETHLRRPNESYVSWYVYDYDTGMFTVWFMIIYDVGMMCLWYVPSFFKSWYNIIEPVPSRNLELGLFVKCNSAILASDFQGPICSLVNQQPSGNQQPFCSETHRWGSGATAPNYGAGGGPVAWASEYQSISGEEWTDNFCGATAHTFRNGKSYRMSNIILLGMSFPEWALQL